ncbi:protein DETOXIFICATION 45, chloroplastic-like [Humulus lupulus]|uniref:protein DETOXIFICATION 45, chloroplastic-like n=1 Tax=Humulus lupulus TaxID=3486 RepID=UPI002B4183C1|nr:protein DETOXIFICATION 45, chloroplastic-like [Humulus lupulus]
MEKEDAERSERERKEFEEREKAWLKAMEMKRKKMEEEEEEEYEEQRKKAMDEESRKQQDVDRPTSNPLALESETFAKYRNSLMSGQQLIESVVKQVPNFETELKLGHVDIVGGCFLVRRHRQCFNPLVTHSRKNRFPVVSNQRSSDSGASSSENDERLVFKDESSLDGGGNGASELAEVPSVVLHSLDVKREIMMLSIPAIAGQALDPLAQLMETAYIGRLGSLELGSAGVSVNIFNYISKLFNIPLLSVATSFVAKDISRSENNSSASETHFLNNSSNGSRPFDVIAERKQLPSVSTTLLLAVMIGTFEALALSLGSGLFLNIMGISSDSPMRAPAQRFLSLRALGAPAVVVSLALQGVFCGFKDTKTLVLCLGKCIGNLLAVILFPILMYSFQMGATGAAISTVVSQYVVTFLMLWFLNKRAILLPPKMGSLQFGEYINSGCFLLGRTLDVLTTMTLGTSMAAH